MKTMSFNDENIYQLLEYYASATWIKKTTIDSLVDLAKAIRDNPRDFYWNAYLNSLEEKYVLSKGFYTIYEQIKSYLIQKKIYQIYQDDSEIKVYVRFYLIVKLQLLLLILNDCQITKKTSADNDYYNLKDIDCINKIFTTLMESNWRDNKHDIGGLLYLINNLAMNENIDIPNKNLNKNNYDHIIIDFCNELKSVRKKLSNLPLFINIFALRYKYLLIGIESIIFEKNKAGMDNLDKNLFS